jgi:hypothetical protein
MTALVTIGKALALLALALGTAALLERETTSTSASEQATRTASIPCFITIF